MLRAWLCSRGVLGDCGIGGFRVCRLLFLGGGRALLGGVPGGC